MPKTTVSNGTGGELFFFDLTPDFANSKQFSSETPLKCLTPLLTLSLKAKLFDEKELFFVQQWEPVFLFLVGREHAPSFLYLAPLSHSMTISFSESGRWSNIDFVEFNRGSMSG